MSKPRFICAAILTLPGAASKYRPIASGTCLEIYTCVLSVLKAIDGMRVRTWVMGKGIAQFMRKYVLGILIPASGNSYAAATVLGDFPSPKPKQPHQPAPLTLPNETPLDRKEARRRRVKRAKELREDVELTRLIQRLQRITDNLP